MRAADAGESHLRAQVAVVGSGAGGATVAADLAERGLDVLILEAGEHLRAADFTQREDEVMPRLYAEEGRRATHDGSIPILQGRCVGGSTVHNTALVYRAPPGILDRWRREHGFGADDATMDRAYRRVESAIGATQIREHEVNAANDALRRGARALGFRYRVPPHNRAGCTGCGYCVLGCAYNRKQSALVTAIPRALAAGARVLAQAEVERFAVLPGGKKRLTVRTPGTGPVRRWGTGDWGSGTELTVECDTLVLAAGAIDTPCILLRSGFRRGIGRTLRIHPTAPVGAIFDRPVRAFRDVPQSVLVEEFATFFDTGRGGYLIMPGFAPPAMTAALVPGIGRDHFAIMREYPRLASAGPLLHDETCGRGRAGRDKPWIDYWPDGPDELELRAGIRRTAEIFLAAGARKVILPFRGAPLVESPGAPLERALAGGRFLPHLVTLSSVHPQGTCPLGSDPLRAAVRPDTLELYEAPSVHVCDASVFPTSLGVPPQTTTMALAALAAEAIAAKHPGARREL